MNDEVVIVRDVRTYKGVEISLTWVDDAVGDFGGFWGWMVGDKIVDPMWRHKGICFDNAKSYVKEQRLLAKKDNLP